MSSRIPARISDALKNLESSKFDTRDEDKSNFFVLYKAFEDLQKLPFDESDPQIELLRECLNLMNQILKFS